MIIEKSIMEFKNILGEVGGYKGVNMHYNSIEDLCGWPVFYSKMLDKYIVKINDKYYYVDDEIRKIIEKSIIGFKNDFSEDGG